MDDPLHTEFLLKHGLTPEQFASTSLNWEELEAIAEDHRNRSKELLDVADMVVNSLRRIPHVHSVKVRVKDPNGLLAKIIRKRIESPDRIINLDNYREEITDLVGARALHLFKYQWRSIHDIVQQNWQAHEEPVAYHREGDPAELLGEFRSAKCKTEVHPAGYRSVHYVVTSTPLKDTHRIEVQVRTVFEEAWAEIDHIVRYPRKSDDKLLASFLDLFNSVAGNADFMGSFLIALRQQLGEQRLLIDSQKIAEAKWKETVSKLAISEREKDELKKQIEAANVASPAIDYTNTFGLTGLTGLGWAKVWPTSIAAQIPDGSTAPVGQIKVCGGCGKIFEGFIQDPLGRYRCPHCNAPAG
jgi:putative GTP pyrophosphokinase